jgi:adenosylcobinamide kinase/adenosylcobinamide-phosphate guanylyltransferase
MERTPRTQSPTVNRIVLVGGGVRSGKSAFALAYARSIGTRRAFIATAQALDAEMRVRIDRHRNERGDSFRTIEAPFDLQEVVGELRDVDVVVIDCLTLWISNLLMRGEGEGEIVDHVKTLARQLRETAFASIVVTSEVGMGIVPESAVARLFRDVMGLAHQHIAESATEIYVALMGCALRLRPPPIAVREGSFADVR